MNACSNCKRNCCAKTGGNLELGSLDCLKLLDYFFSERVNDSSWSSKTSVFFGLRVYHGSSEVFRVNNSWGFLNGILIVPSRFSHGKLVNHCSFLSGESCGIYNVKSSDSSLSDWLAYNHFSLDVRPFVCRSFPYFVNSSNFFEGRESSEWVEESGRGLRNTLLTGCAVAGLSLDDSSRSLLSREKDVYVKCNNDSFIGLLKHDFKSVIYDFPKSVYYSASQVRI